MDEILKIVLDRNKKRKVLSKNDIRRICEIIISKSNFYVVPNISFGTESTNNKSFAADTGLDEVKFYMPVLEESLENSYEEINTTSIFDGTREDYYNYRILEVIFHEFSHVRQNDKIIKGHSDIDTRLFYICDKLRAIKGFYSENYSLFSLETDAYARGFINSYLIYSRFPKEYMPERDRTSYASMVMKTLISPYIVSSSKETIKSPSEILLEKADNYNLSKRGIDIETYRGLVNGRNDLTLYKKLLLGLPLTYSEASYVNMLKSCVEVGEKVDFIKKLQKRL